MPIKELIKTSGQGENQVKETQKLSSGKAGKKRGLLFLLLAVFTAVAIIGGIFWGVFYYIFHNNIGGATDKYRKNIQDIPVLSYALPKLKNPDDPKNYTDDQLRKKYTEVVDSRNQLNKKVDELNKQIAELKKYKDDADAIRADSAKVKADADTQKAQLDKEKQQLEDDKKSFGQMVAANDTKGFKSFYEKLDKDTASKIYQQIVEKDQQSADELKFAQLYESMDPSAAAKIFEKMADSKADLVVNTLKNMKKDSSSAVIAAMDPSLASKLSGMLSDSLKGVNTSITSPVAISTQKSQ